MAHNKSFRNTPSVPGQRKPQKFASFRTTPKQKFNSFRSTPAQSGVFQQKPGAFQSQAGPLQGSAPFQSTPNSTPAPNSTPFTPQFGPPKPQFTPAGQFQQFGDQAATNPEKAKFIASRVAPTSTLSPTPATGSTTTPQPTPVTPPSTTLAPPTTEQPSTTLQPPQETPADRAFKAYLASLQPSSELTSARENLAKFDTQAALDQEKALERGDTLGFARGEAGLTARQNAILRGGAAASVSALSGLDERRRDIGKARFDFEQGKLDTAEQRRLADIETAVGAEERTESRRQFDVGSAQEDREFAENKRQFGIEFAEDQRRFGAEFAETKRQFNENKKEGKDSAKNANLISAADAVVRDAERAFELMSQSPLFDDNATGTVASFERSSRSKFLRGPVYEVWLEIESIKGNIGIDALLNIKREGSGLGQVPQKQLETLQGLLGRLDIGREPKILKRNLNDVMLKYQAILNNFTSEDIAAITGKSIEGDETQQSVLGKSTTPSGNVINITEI